MPPVSARLLGAPSLTDAAGVRIEALLAQPKRFAVLAYLLVEARGTPVMRDKVAALFWPELDQQRARQALRQSLHVIRKELGEDAIVGVGAEMLALGEGAASSDVAEFDAAVDAGRLTEAVALYRGQFLDGFYVPDAPEFDQWLGAVRSRLRDAVVRAVGRLAADAEAAGNADDAVRWLRRQLSLGGVDERPLRRLMAVLRAQGNAAAAVAAFDDYAAWMHREMEMEPSEETLTLAAEIRAEAASSGAPPQRVGESFVAAAGAPASSASPRILPRVAFAATIGIAVVGAVFLATRNGTGEPGDAAPSIAVLPFLDLSPAKDQQFLSDGLTEELITALSRVRGLRVTARTSSFAYRDVRTDVPRIARELRVATVLEGSVRRDGDKLRITVQLIDARTGFHLWSDNFDRSVPDIIAMEAEIADAITRALRVQLVGPTPQARLGAPTVAVAVHDAYLRGRFFWNQRNAGSIRTAIDLFREAIRIDSSYAAAYAGLAGALQLAPNFAVLAPEVAFPQAVEAAQRALALDPESAEAHASHGYIKLQWEHDWAAAERELARAIDLAPGYATAHQWMRLAYLALGNLDSALASARRARDLDPVSISIQCAVGDVFLARRQYDSALVAYRTAEALDPDFDRALSAQSRVASLRGDHATAITLAERAVGKPPLNTRYLGSLAMIYGRAGRRADALRIADSLRTIARREYVPPFAFVAAHIGTGNADSTVRWIGESIATRDAFAIDLWAYPELDWLARDARYRAMLAKLGQKPR